MKLYLILLCALGLCFSLTDVVSANTTLGYHLLQRIAVGGNEGWDYLTFDSASQRLYVSRSTHVTVLNVTNGKVVGKISGTAGVHGIALAPTLQRGFTSNGEDQSVTVFDLTSLKTLKHLKIGVSPDAILFDAHTQRVFAMSGDANTAVVIDALKLTVIKSIKLGGSPEACVSDEQGQLFINIADKGEIVTCDTQTLTVKSRWSLAPGEDPSGLALDPVHHRLFAVCGNKKMAILDSQTGHVISTPTIGNGPDGAAFDAASGCIFSANGRDGTLTVLHEDDAHTFTMVQNVTTQPGARTLTLDPLAHRIYLPTATVTMPARKAGSSAPPPSRHFAVTPNSFVILVMGP